MCETIWKKCAVFIKLPECHMNTCIKDTWPNASSTYIYVHEFTNCKHQSNRFRTDYLTSNIAFLQAYLTEEIVQVKSSNNSEKEHKQNECVTLQVHYQYGSCSVHEKWFKLVILLTFTSAFRQKKCHTCYTWCEIYHNLSVLHNNYLVL